MSGLSAKLERLTGDHAYALWFFSRKSAASVTHTGLRIPLLRQPAQLLGELPKAMLLGFLSHDSNFSM